MPHAACANLHQRRPRAAPHSQTTHYLYEPDTFVPLAQAIRTGPIGLIPEPPVPDTYDIDEDPLWLHDPTPPPIDTLAWYQCDHLGTPQEITGPDGETAWTANYKAWGEATEALTAAARKAGIRNPLRFQGQYHDHETGLHYNRHRYYDPHSVRFLSKDPDVWVLMGKMTSSSCWTELKHMLTVTKNSTDMFVVGAICIMITNLRCAEL